MRTWDRSANRRGAGRRTIINAYAGMGFYAKDLFVVVRSNRPHVAGMKRQMHARKNHSYFVVFVKPAGKRRA